MIFLGIFVAFFFIAVPAYASVDCSVGPVPLEVSIGTVGSVTGLANYISELYSFIVGSIGIFAAVMIMFNGLRWVSAAGNASRIAEAKDGIVSALIGLFLALISYTILIQINPYLVSIPEICPTGIEFAGDFNTSGWESCPSATDSECNGVDYCQFDGGCTCDNVGTTEDSYVCRPIGTDTITNGYRCKEDANCKGYADSTLLCVGSNTAGSEPGICAEQGVNRTCTTDDDCTAPLTCEDSTTSGSKQCLSATGRANYLTCDNDTQCESGVCNESESLCSPGDGSEDSSIVPCSNDNDCTLAYECGGSICQAKSVGSDCDVYNSTCGAGLYCTDTVGTDTCYDGTPGSWCADDDDCISGSCDFTAVNECD